MSTSSKKSDAPQPAHTPVLLTVVGRQRTGKTTFLNALAETVALRGGRTEIWNTDMLNTTNSIQRFHSDAQSPPYLGNTDQTIWLDEKIASLVETPRDVLLDIGGGWTAFHDMITTTTILSDLKDFGIRPVVAYMFGPDPADADYLADLQRHKSFHGSDSILVFNRGLIPPGTSQHTAFKPAFESLSVREAVNAGASTAMLPELLTMPKVLKSGASFTLYGEKHHGAGPQAGNFMDRLRVNRWFNDEFVKFLREIDPTRLPAMPSGLDILPARHSA
ncbi:hypothetical protein [Kozakia baliensis]|uniref:Uncharacterized protein n=1 Tax=Kozakia baliensis TaxID=153496 RepID=A0A1D8UXK4_9PROT|nr:hypothetical protein [Kozakia baliensis]AOX18385.1 hypothetical protein A0U89_13755 [Kozakia baliensis]GBR33862.1 hypothetical protein AA0488_2784 [Kozakia baliensis NRIC 0488]GEL65763.1 hypothetical protein KBA01_30490 [Kozakia baliensis]